MISKKLLWIALVLSISVSVYLYASTHSNVVRWQKKSNDKTLIWVTKNPHFIAVKLWLEMTNNLWAIAMITYSGIQLIRKRRKDEL